MFEITVNGNKYQLKKGHYVDDNNLAIAMFIDDGGYEPAGVMTTNLGHKMKERHAFVCMTPRMDYPDLREMMFALEEQGLVMSTFYFERSGFCEYYEYIFTNELLSQMEEIK